MRTQTEFYILGTFTNTTAHHSHEHEKAQTTRARARYLSLSLCVCVCVRVLKSHSVPVEKSAATSAWHLNVNCRNPFVLWSHKVHQPRLFLQVFCTPSWIRQGECKRVNECVYYTHFSVISLFFHFFLSIILPFFFVKSDTTGQFKIKILFETQPFIFAIATRVWGLQLLVWGGRWWSLTILEDISIGIERMNLISRI